MAGIEIDFLPVGEASKSGDAIVMRVGDDNQSQVIVVDGGNLAAGNNAVEHIKEHYGNPSEIEHVVCTHQDGDHASGLRKIIEHFKVNNLWVHQPWLYADYLVDAFHHNWSANGLYNHLRNDCFPIVASLCDLAEEYGVPLRQPLQGDTIGPWTVLAPSLDRDLGLIPQMEQTPLAAKSDSVFAGMMKVVKEAVLGTLEAWHIETLGTPKDGDTSVTNETSVVLFGQFAESRFLLTADAGVGALTDALSGAAANGIDLVSPSVVQIPHHGSRRNVSPGVLDAILGGKLSDDQAKRGFAISSVAAKADGYPRRVVENAFTRRGYQCTTTKEGWVNWTIGMTRRGGMNAVTVSPFHQIVED
jgi:beta-lactamase superfamily II metal-dependent hydrolase